eukprot:gene1781-1900_t
MAPTWIPLCRTMQRYCEPYFAAVESWRNYEESTLLVNRVMLAETAYHILEEFSLQKDTYYFDLVYDTDVELLPEIEPTPGRTFVFGGDREAFEAARKYVPEPFFNRIGLFFQQLLLKSMAGHNDSYVQQANTTTRKSILEAIEKLFRLPESAGKGKFVYSLAHTTAGQDPTTAEDLFKKFKVYSLHPLSPAGKSFVEYLIQSKTGRKPYIPPPSPVVPAVTASSVPPHSTKRDEDYYSSSSSESESEPELPKPVVKQVPKRRVGRPVSNPPTKKKNVYQLKDSDSDSDDDEEVKDFDELIEKEQPKTSKSNQVKKQSRTTKTTTKTPPTTSVTTTPTETPKKKRQSKGSTPSSTKSKSTPTTTPTTTTPSTSATKKRAQTKPESIKWITDHFSIGTRVAAFFSLPTEEGGFENQLYFGTVIRYAAPSKPDKKGDQLYHIQWEDGDEQDYDESELQKGILLYNQENQWIYQHESIGTKVAGEFALPSQYPSLTNVVRRRKSSNNTIKKKLFIGKVTKFLPATSEKENDQLYHIVWEDGDEEDYYENDLIRGKELYLQYLQDKANDFGNTRNKTIFNDGEDENDDDVDGEGKKEGEEDDHNDKEEEKERTRRVQGKEETKMKIKEEVEIAIESEIEKKKRLQELERRNRRRKRLGLSELLDSDEDEEKQEIKRRKREAKEEKEREEREEEETRLKYHNSNNNEEEEEDDDRRTWIKQHSSIGNDVATYITTATIIASTGKTSTRRSLIYGRVMKYSPETRDGKKNQRYLVIWNPNSPELRTQDKINEVQYQAALALYRATNSSNNALPAKEEVKSVADAMNEAEEDERQPIIMDEDDEVMVTINRDRNKDDEGGDGVKESGSGNGISNGVEEVPNSFLKIQDDFNDDDISIEINVKRLSQPLLTTTNEAETVPAPLPVAAADVTVLASDIFPPPPESASIEISHNSDDAVEVSNVDLVESNVSGVSEEIAVDNQTDENEVPEEVAMDVDEKDIAVNLGEKELPDEATTDRLEDDQPSPSIIEETSPDLIHDIIPDAVSAMEVEESLSEAETKNEKLTADNPLESVETGIEESTNECQVI